ncbi:MAG: tetratricopeptide repeat protein [Porticoccaceae bacterium]
MFRLETGLLTGLLLGYLLGLREVIHSKFFHGKHQALIQIMSLAHDDKVSNTDKVSVGLLATRLYHGRQKFIAVSLTLSLAFLCSNTYSAGPADTETSPDTNPNTNTDTQVTVDNSLAIEAPIVAGDNSVSSQQLLLSRELKAFQNAIDKNEEHGPYNPALAETYYGLGLQLQRSGQHEAAIKLFSQTMHIERINQGIYSLAQSPALRGVINSRKALGQLEETTEDYYRLLWLHQKSLDPTNPEVIPVFLELSRWHLTAYEFDNSSESIGHLTTANQLIIKALKLAQQSDIQQAVASQTLHTLLRTAALCNYFLSRHQGDDWSSSLDSRFGFASQGTQDVLPMRTAVLSSASYSRGRSAHETIVTMVQNDENSSVEQRARSYAELGDWHLLFGKRDKAYATYRQAVALIPQTPQAAALTERLFNRPIMLPAVRNEAPGSELNSRIKHPMARIKVDIAANGWASNVEMLDATNPQGNPQKNPKAGADTRLENKRMRRRVITALRAARFRPRFVNGEPVASRGEIIDFPLIH